MVLKVQVSDPRAALESFVMKNVFYLRYINLEEHNGSFFKVFIKKIKNGNRIIVKLDFL